MIKSAEPPFFAPPKWEAVFPLIGAIIVDQIFRHMGQADRGTVALASTLALLSSLRMSWRLRKHTWFWITWGLLLVLHVCAILAFRWTGSLAWRAPSFIPFAIADLILDMTILYLLYCAFQGRPTQLFADD